MEEAMKGWLQKRNEQERNGGEGGNEKRGGREKDQPTKEGERREEEKPDEEDKWRHPYGSGTRKNSSAVANKRIFQSILYA